MEKAKRAALMALGSVIDPEVGLDVVTMGLLYGLDVTPDRVDVRLTLTSQGCPLGPTIVNMAREALDGVAGDRAVSIELRWDPPWSPDMLSRDGRRRLMP
ncbi:MAG: metal-sulfur cluster assembly factor [Elusimicrobia bacterium]|nr:metal-sulfur cluster assembly factor [Elusimicrobiota bacterium]